MTVEEVLVTLGDQPLNKCAYSLVLMAMLNAYLPGDKPVTREMTGAHLLTMIYQMPNDELIDKVLNKKVSTVRSSDPYRHVVLVVAVVITGLSTLLAFSQVLGTNDLTIDEKISMMNVFTHSTTKILDFITSAL